MKRNPAEVLYESTPIQIILALVVNAIYAAIVGIALVPTAVILYYGIGSTLASGALPSVVGFVLVGLTAGGAVFAYFLFGALVYGLLIRLISLGMRPGRYPKVSMTTVRWLIYSGIYNIAQQSVLPFIPVSWFATAFFKIIGAKLGRNVYIRTPYLNDAFLITVEDDVVIGGMAEVSPHLVEKDWLHLTEVRIGKSSLVGTGAYISPGVTIGENCVIGARCYIRKGSVIPDGSVYTVVAGRPMREIISLEKRRR